MPIPVPLRLPEAMREAELVKKLTLPYRHNPEDALAAAYSRAYGTATAITRLVSMLNMLSKWIKHAAGLPRRPVGRRTQKPGQS